LEEIMLVGRNKTLGNNFLLGNIFCVGKNKKTLWEVQEK
jgi:hypothetical protein